MDSRRRLSALALAVAALAACAAARPGAGNDIDVAAKTLNEISSKEALPKADATTEPQVVESKPDVASPSAQPDDEAQPDTEAVESNADADTNSEGTKADIKAEGDAAPDERAINERYPHAVLFGGTCGGTIISPTWVLSAGHWLWRLFLISPLFGSTLFTGGRYILAGTNNSEDGSGIMRRVKRLVIHPLFSVGPYWLDADKFGFKQVAARWDFLLAELDDPLPLDGKTIAAVELDDQKTIPEGLEVGYAGYGAEHHGETMRSDMHGMELQVLADARCRDSLVQYNSEDMICTQGRPPRHDTACNGDSGSGLVANGKLYGAASWVEDDAHRCFNGALVVFSRVSAARDWIRQVTSI